MTIKYGYNPFKYKSEYYNDFEKRRTEAGQKKPAQQIKDEATYGGSVKKFWEHNEKWKKEQTQREEKENNGNSRKEYWKTRYVNKKKEKK